MSVKDLTACAAVAMARKPDNTAMSTATAEEPKTDGKGATPETKMP